MKQGKDVTITSKGQLTLPVSIRTAMKLGAKRKVRIAMDDEGLITIQPLPDVMSFFGSLRSEVPYRADEKRKARTAMGKRAFRKH